MQKKRVIVVFITGLLIIAAIFTLINFNDIRSKGIAGFFKELFNPEGKKRLDSKVINSEEQNALYYEIYKNTVIYAGQEGVSAMNLKGEWLWDETSVSFLNPYIKVAGDYILVVEINGKYALFFKDKNLIWKTEFPEGIISADLSKEGYAVISHNVENYNSAVTVLKPTAEDGKKGDVLFNTKINSEQLVAASVSKDSGQVMLSGVITDNEEIKGSLTFVDMKDGKSYSSIKVEENIYPIIKYIDDETVIAANANSLRKFKRSKSSSADSDIDKDLWSAYNTYTIYAVGISEGYMVISAGNDSGSVYSNNSETSVFIMDFDGKELEKISLSEVINRIDTGNNTFALSSKNRTSIYNAKGEKLYDYSTVSEIQKVLVADEDNYIVITNKDVHILKTSVG